MRWNCTKFKSVTLLILSFSIATFWFPIINPETIRRGQIGSRRNVAYWYWVCVCVCVCVLYWDTSEDEQDNNNSLWLNFRLQTVQLTVYFDQNNCIVSQDDSLLEIEKCYLLISIYFKVCVHVLQLFSDTTHIRTTHSVMAVYWVTSP